MVSIRRTFHIAATLFLGMLYQNVLGQCGLSAYLETENCSGVGGPEMMALSVNSGTPPFTVVSSGGASIYITNSTPPFYYEWFPPQTVCDAPFTIIDGNTCITTTVGQDQITIAENLYFEIPYPDGPDNGILYNCMTGNADVRIRCFDVTYLSNNFEQYYTYALTGPVNRTGSYGGLTVDPPLYYAKWLLDLPAGTYSITLVNNGTSALPFACNSVITECTHGVNFTYSFTIPTAPFTPGDCGVNVSPSVFLQGATTIGDPLMRDDLRSALLIPGTEPYSGLGYVYTDPGTNGIGLAQSALSVSGPQAIVDWVIVELRQPTTPFSIVASRPALLRRNGDIIDLDIDSYVNFPNTPAGMYRVSVLHRNHLGIMNGGSVLLSTDPAMVDMTQPSSSLHGVNATIMVNGRKCLWGGNGNFNDRVTYSGQSNDRDLILSAIGGVDPTNTILGYTGSDCTMDGLTKYTGLGNDREMILQNIGGNLPTGILYGQLP